MTGSPTHSHPEPTDQPTVAGVADADPSVQRHANPGGPTVASASGRFVQVDGLWFRDPDGTGELQPWNDWRRTPDERARALASRLDVEQIAGLMLYSAHQVVPGAPAGPFPSTYGGGPFDPAQHDAASLSDQQRDFLLSQHIRHVLVISFADVDIAVRWHNRMQATAEAQPFGIPVNFSTDPRHAADEGFGAEFRGSGVSTSKWPEGLGMAATFDLDHVRRMADAVRQEYRALGFATALGPQVDLATEPRWMRAMDTFGGHVDQVVEIARTYIDGLQTTPGAPEGWGPDSVIAMAKHWPGGGTGEGGRDAHYWFGMYNVYPGDNFEEHLRPFRDGAFDLPGPTKQAGAVMPYYSVSVGHSGPDEVGNSYSHTLINDLLRGDLGYDGVVCTDWGITDDAPDGVDTGDPEGFHSRCYGVRDLSVAERHLRILMNGADQFGGNNDAEPVLEAWRLGCERFGEQVMRARFEQAAARLLRGMFRVGLFDDPYLDADASRRTVANEQFVRDGHAAQLASIVELKRGPRIPRGAKVWVPDRHIGAHKGFFRTEVPASTFAPLSQDSVGDAFELVERPEDADIALVFMSSPICDPFVDGEYRPISLQYRSYDAPTAREHSLAGTPDRSYRGRSASVANTHDLDNLEAARAAMGERPVVAVVQLDIPVIMSEVEPLADSLFVHFGVSKRAALEVVTGAATAGGGLPYRLPASMDAVEQHHEDVFGDFEPYVDTLGNTYDHGFGLGRR